MDIQILLIVTNDLREPITLLNLIRRWFIISVMNTISPADLQKLLLAQPDLQLLDVRTPVEFAEIHVPCAENEPPTNWNPKKCSTLAACTRDKAFTCFAVPEAAPPRLPINSPARASIKLWSSKAAPNLSQSRFACRTRLQQDHQPGTAGPHRGWNVRVDRGPVGMVCACRVLRVGSVCRRGLDICRHHRLLRDGSCSWQRCHGTSVTPRAAAFEFSSAD